MAIGTSIRLYIIFQNIEIFTPNEQFLALMAEGIVTPPLHVTYIYVLEPMPASRVLRFLKRYFRGSRITGKLIVRVKPGKMPGDVPVHTRDELGDTGTTRFLNA